MQKEHDFFPIGATYAPLPKATEVDLAEWPQDLENFKKLGLNTFRLFICWDRVEQKHGVRDFSRIDRAFELAEKNKLHIIANVGGTFTNLQAIYPPRWLVYDLGCTLLKPTPESPEELRANRFKLCYDDPVYQREAKDFIQEAIARYKDRPELIAWSGWNEPRLAECHCRHTLALYRNYLQKKYGSLEALAAGWSSEFPVSFRDWSDVFPQVKAGFEFGGYVPYLDWCRFMEQNRTDKFHMIRNWIRDIDQKTPVISHLCGAYHSDIFGEEDILGTSIYTIHAQGKGADYDPYEFTRRQNVQFMPEGQRGNRQDSEGFWVVETEAGPVSWVHDLIPRSYSPRKMNARDMYLIGHGARAILRWLYRSRVSDAQAGEFNLVGWDGRITERASEFGKMAQFIQNHGDIFSCHTALNSDVMILDSRDCDYLSSCEGYGYRYSDGFHNWYLALLDVGVRGTMCNVRQLLDGCLKNARMLIIPFRPHLDSAMAAKLRDFIENGGVVLAESPFDIKDLRGVHHRVTPGNMTDVFGAQVFDLEKLEEDLCGDVPAYDFRAKIDVREAEVDGRFSNGDPAIVSHRYGKGRAVLYGSVLGQLYSPASGTAFRQELTKRLQQAGVTTQWHLDGLDVVAAANIQILRRKLPEGRELLFILNMDDRNHAFSLAIPGKSNGVELGNSDAVPSKPMSGETIHCSLAEWGWSVWLFNKAD